MASTDTFNEFQNQLSESSESLNPNTIELTNNQNTEVLVSTVENGIESTVVELETEEISMDTKVINHLKSHSTLNEYASRDLQDSQTRPSRAQRMSSTASLLSNSNRTSRFNDSNEPSYMRPTFASLSKKRNSSQ